MCSVVTAAVVPVTPGVNNIPIVQVSYLVNGTPVTQTTEASGVINSSDTPVLITNIRVNDGVLKDLNFFNGGGAEVRNLNFTASTGGVGVFNNGVITTTSNLSNFALAMAGVTQDADLRNMSFYDGTSNLPGPTVPDFDVLFYRGLTIDDFVFVSERWGNTFFEITPLKADGTPFTDANVLRFGGNGGSAYTVYDWNSGYAAAGNVPGQAQAFSVAKVSRFFEGTSVAPQTVYGFRIDNNGEADVKFGSFSDNTFDNNPINPLLIPEPTLTSFILGGVLLVLIQRLRGRRDPQ